MLMKISYEVIQSLLINLVFDDETVKRVKVECGDYVAISYNKNGKRINTDGYIKRIFLDNGYRDCRQHWCIILDKSEDGTSPACYLDKLDVSKILNIDMLRKKSESGLVSSPIGDNIVTDFRLVGNELQLSQDHGITWVKALELPVDKPAADPEDSELVTKIDEIVPDNLRADVQEELMQGILNLIKEVQASHVCPTVPDTDTDVPEDEPVVDDPIVEEVPIA